jgi:hypothetical protein
MAARFKLKTFNELAEREPPQWLIADLIQARGLIAVYGESTAGKSFFLLSMAAHLASGRRWAGRRVKKCKVVYISLEGDTRNRAAAFIREFGPVPDLYTVENAPLSLVSDNDVLTLIRDIKAQLEGYTGVVVVILDTWARAIAGADENTGTEVGLAIANCSRIQVALNAVVMFAHHSGKDASRGMRGWSGLKAAVDGEILVEHESDGTRFATFSKVKDGRDGVSVQFDLEVVDLGPRSAYDPEADPDERDTSCVVKVIGQPAAKPEKRRIGATERLVLDALGQSGELSISAMSKLTGKTEKALTCSIERLSKHEPISIHDGIVRRNKPS